MSDAKAKAEQLARELSGLAAEYTCSHVLNHIDTMYPRMWKGIPKAARISLSNTVLMEVSRHAVREFLPVLEKCYEALTIGNNYLLGSLEEYRDAGEDDCSLAIGIRKALHEMDAALALFELPGEGK